MIFAKIAEFLQLEYIYAQHDPSCNTINPVDTRNFYLKQDSSPTKIILAEDNLVNQKIALRILEKLGYGADVVSNGREAILALQKQSYDLVFMDVQMPEMDGLEATHQICKLWPPEQRPIIIGMTASQEEKDRKLCLEAGMTDFVPKPIHVDEIKNILAKYLPKKVSEI
ncbi:MAG: response regulator [Sphaerospermopsis sp. SIO1G2]|nr:response regulator [Sphaerospermopsis sp. SIO1G2]